LYFDLLRRWLLDCNKHVKEYDCIPDNVKPKFWPTRLLFVGGFDASRLKLKLTESISDKDVVKYVALYHCWGRPTNEQRKLHCTTKDNYEDRLQGFSIEELPKTFQHAIEVTRELGQNFLWIDALCIIQAVQGGADTDDWEKEAERMEETFSSAYCTIAADSAAGWDQGFLPLASTSPVIDPQSSELVYKCNTRYEFDFNEDVNNSQLNRRAWVLQERALSGRSIHFTRSSTYFACGLGIRCGHIADQTMYD
jgi:hypothetical protein